MKSRTSCFNPAAFRKNLTRFAPAWVLYTVLMLMFLLSFAASDTGVWFASNLAEMTHFTAVVGMGYALLNAQLLFGDLYNSRMCNALHAMPIRRESWFITNVTSGVAFSLVPNAAFTLIFLLLSGGVWEAPVLWFVVAALQYLFFFGIAALSAYCVGNRFAMALVYGIVNFFSLIVYWLVSSLYEPLLYGITISEDIFTLLCPVLQLTGNDYFYVNYDITAGGAAIFKALEFGDGWLYLAACAVLGAGAIVLALVLYRRRNLECAGDFVALRRLGPVFLVLYTFCAGACCHGFFSLLWGEDSYGFLVLGLGVGFFTGLMLLHRTVRVLHKKSILAFAGLLAVFAVSLVLTALDPIGITRWVPKAEQVQSARISTGSSIYYAGTWTDLSKQEDIENILAIHEQCLRHREEGFNGEETVRVYLSYTLKSGLTEQREYHMSVETDMGLLLESMLSKPEVVLGEIYTRPQANPVINVQFTDGTLEWVTEPDLDALVDAIVKDCEAGVMAQDWAFMEDEDYTGWLYLESRYFNGIYHGRDIRFNTQCTNIIAWLEENSDFSLDNYIVQDGKYAEVK